MIFYFLWSVISLRTHYCLTSQCPALLELTIPHGSAGIIKLILDFYIMGVLVARQRPAIACRCHMRVLFFFQAGNGGNRKSCGSSKVSATGNSSSQSAQQQSTPASTQAPTPSSGSGGGGGAPSNGGHHHHHHAHRPNKTPGHNLLDPIQVLCTNLIPLYLRVYLRR